MPKSVHFIIIFLFSANACFAQDDTKPKTIKSTINLYGKTFVYGAPPWVDTTAPDFEPTDLLNKSKPFREQKGNSFIFEQIPADEEFDNWTTMFAVKALAVKQDVPLENWEAFNMEPFVKACEGLKASRLAKTDKMSLVQIVCPKVTGFNLHGYDNGVGEIGLMAYYKTDSVLISHYIEWRGDAFDINDVSTWPISKDKFDASVASIKLAGPISLPNDQSNNNQTFLPIVRVPPQYPTRAIENKIEGHVIVSFTVDKEGKTKDFGIVESSHKLFERNAIKAVEKYKYRPRMVDGEPVEVKDVKVRIDFNLG